MEAKKICLDVIAYLLTAFLLFYSAWSGFKHGNKTIAAITFITGAFVVWSAWENYKGMSNSGQASLNNGSLVGSLAPM